MSFVVPRHHKKWNYWLPVSWFPAGRYPIILEEWCRKGFRNRAIKWCPAIGWGHWIHLLVRISLLLWGRRNVGSGRHFSILRKRLSEFYGIHPVRHHYLKLAIEVCRIRLPELRRCYRFVRRHDGWRRRNDRKECSRLFLCHIGFPIRWVDGWGYHKVFLGNRTSRHLNPDAAQDAFPISFPVFQWQALRRVLSFLQSRLQR